MNHDQRILRTTILCGLVVVVEGYDLSVLGYVVPQLVDTWGMPAAAFTVALTAGNVGMFLGAVGCGWLGDRYGRKPVLLGCIGAFGVASLLTAITTDATQLAWARLATGIGLGGGIPTCIALVSDVSPPHRQGTLVIAMITGVVIGNLLAGIVSASMLEAFGWPSVFVVGGVVPILLLPIIALFLPESGKLLAIRAEAALSGQTLHRASALLGPRFLGQTVLLWSINFLNLLTIYFVNSWLPSILRGMGATTEGAILATSMFHVGAIVAAFVSGSLVGRFGIERVLTVMLVFGGACLFVTGVANLTVTILGFFVLGFGFGTNGSQLGISALPGAIYPTEIRSTGAGWATGIGRLGNISGALLGGALLGLGWSSKEMLLALATAPLVTSLLMWQLGRRRRAEHLSARGVAAVAGEGTRRSTV
ncbi:MAG TPA: aromatic acid/H+ symport family MFS transporter [Vicinamibacterales bacterium]|nr:aromatic acid/H+ symport family MFS transporter [Vicinamibacterales bacterium]